MLVRYSIVAVALLAFVSDSAAGPRRRAEPVYRTPSHSSQQATVVPAGGYSAGYAAPLSVAQPVVPAAFTVGGSSVVVTDGAGVIAGPVASFGAGDGLDEVNAKRAARGLRPFLRDPGLTQAAHACAAFRAERGLFGHTSNDFAFVPPGASASSAGCAAYPAGYGWMSCCTYDSYTYAGAAWVTGRDGKRYMHLFVR